ncbi:hypothetical protein HETIRDRAFT_408856 [Heterobasidion irregulare TC 32-1]|uniref:Uncharacterized protein n=1 Tax=Heterobasidion irregulare (strain TC 32-1) TaxID=747525 RepID=W4KA34_HETIT|nr:uncharacterized protein HETIRDRAFT_408856 [Heterobasidion irregulare TC 32-1]ETW82697.1 hypothetical protein HETIRDRAFT_408856 [Heterobasidion irregulare TC 32-1]
MGGENKGEVIGPQQLLMSVWYAWRIQWTRGGQRKVGEWRGSGGSISNKRRYPICR